jgi:ribosome biogenesis protein MAK21
LYKSVKTDPNLQRAKAFLKRISICSTECAPAMTAGLLFMISEIMSARPELKALLSEHDSLPKKSKKSEVDEDSDDETSVDDNEVLGNFHVNKRNPLFAVASTGSPSLFELSLLRHHFHPSVQAFAEALVDTPQHAISFSGDPLTEFNLISFLNRFAYKNPKQKVAKKVAQLSYDELPMNEAFTSGEPINESQIAPEKHFFYKFFGERDALRSMGKSRDRKKKNKDDDEDGDSSDEDDEEGVDRYADQLADDLMRHDARTRGEDFVEDEDDDDDDFGDDIEIDDDDDDSELVGKKSRKPIKSSIVDEDDEDDDINFDADQGEDEEGSETGNFDEPEAYVDSDDEPSFVEEVKTNKKKGKRTKHMDDDDDNAFADVSLYEDQMEEIVNKFKREAPATKIARAMKERNDKEGAISNKGKKRKLR